MNGIFFTRSTLKNVISCLKFLFAFFKTGKLEQFLKPEYLPILKRRSWEFETTESQKIIL